MANPAKRAARANPKAGRDDKPKNSGEDAAVVKLSYAGNDKTQKSCGKWIAHILAPLKSTAKFHTTTPANLFGVLSGRKFDLNFQFALAFETHHPLLP